MYEISFIFKINQGPIEHGKIIVDYLSDDHEGIDNEIKDFVCDVLSEYRSNKKLSSIQKLELGVLGIIKDWCSENEKNIFSVYIDRINKKYYCNGERVFISNC
jgi:hypothetical protein